LKVALYASHITLDWFGQQNRTQCTAAVCRNLYVSIWETSYIWRVVFTFLLSFLFYWQLCYALWPLSPKDGRLNYEAVSHSASQLIGGIHNTAATDTLLVNRSQSGQKLVNV